jgi:hypothetical protein
MVLDHNVTLSNNTVVMYEFLIFNMLGEIPQFGFIGYGLAPITLPLWCRKDFDWYMHPPITFTWYGRGYIISFRFLSHRVFFTVGLRSW